MCPSDALRAGVHAKDISYTLSRLEDTGALKRKAVYIDKRAAAAAEAAVGSSSAGGADAGTAAGQAATGTVWPLAKTNLLSLCTTRTEVAGAPLSAFEPAQDDVETSLIHRMVRLLAASPHRLLPLYRLRMELAIDGTADRSLWYRLRERAVHEGLIEDVTFQRSRPGAASLGVRRGVRRGIRLLDRSASGAAAGAVIGGVLHVPLLDHTPALQCQSALQAAGAAGVIGATLGPALELHYKHVTKLTNGLLMEHGARRQGEQLGRVKAFRLFATGDVAPASAAQVPTERRELLHPPKGGRAKTMHSERRRQWLLELMQEEAVVAVQTLRPYLQTKHDVATAADSAFAAGEPPPRASAVGGAEAIGSAAPCGPLAPTLSAPGTLAVSASPAVGAAATCTTVALSAPTPALPGEARGGQQPLQLDRPTAVKLDNLTVSRLVDKLVAEGRLVRLTAPHPSSAAPGSSSTVREGAADAAAAAAGEAAEPSGIQLVALPGVAADGPEVAELLRGLPAGKCWRGYNTKFQADRVPEFQSVMAARKRRLVIATSHAPKGGGGRRGSRTAVGLEGVGAAEGPGPGSTSLARRGDADADASPEHIDLSIYDFPDGQVRVPDARAPTPPRPHASTPTLPSCSPTPMPCVPRAVCRPRRRRPDELSAGLRAGPRVPGAAPARDPHRDRISPPLRRRRPHCPRRAAAVAPLARLPAHLRPRRDAA